jgi:membrane protein DedA with SNARE-associated domain
LGASIIWPTTIISLGHLFGKIFPNLIKFTELGMVFVLIILGIPVVVEFIKIKKH